MKDRVIALAGLLQAVRLVQEMANNGQAESRPLAACIGSLFAVAADPPAAGYGGVADHKQGQHRVVAQLDGSDRDAGQTRIAMNVLHLERRFMAAAGVADAVHQALLDIDRQREALGLSHPTILQRLGELYAERISPLGPRVLVQGNPVYLSQASLVGEVRATLLAALRSAVLWRQSGGSYWDFLLSRRRMVDIARELLDGRSSPRG